MENTTYFFFYLGLSGKVDNQAHLVDQLLNSVNFLCSMKYWYYCNLSILLHLKHCCTLSMFVLLSILSFIRIFVLLSIYLRKFLWHWRMTIGFLSILLSTLWFFLQSNLSTIFFYDRKNVFGFTTLRKTQDECWVWKSLSSSLLTWIVRRDNDINDGT